MTVGAIAAVGICAAVWLLVSPPPANTGGGTAATTTAPQLSGPDPTATPVAGSEVQAPDATAAPIDRIPPRTSQAPRITTPLPPSGAAKGDIVAGFPLDLAGPAAGSDVLDTSVTSEGDTMQFALVARTDSPGNEVRDHFSALWTELGLAPDGAAFQDAYTSISVTVDETTGTGTVYTVYGVLRAA
jgi:hypothetical protein